MTGPFKLGQLVQWTSTARLRVAVVVAIVPAGEPPSAHMPPGRWVRMFDLDAVRQSESYLVALKGGSGAGILHRPWVGLLRPFGAGSEPAPRRLRPRLPRVALSAPVAVAPVRERPTARVLRAFRAACARVAFLVRLPTSS